MAQFEDSYRNKVAALLRVRSITRSLREDNIPCQIEEGLFLGSVGAAGNKLSLKNSNINHILTIANTLQPAYPNEFVYKIIPVMDKEETNLRQYFDECFNFIEKAKSEGGGVLVHCMVGRSRSVTIVIAYLMKKYDMSLSQALEHVKTKRPVAAPNFGFILQLQEFERSLKGNRESEMTNN